MLRGRRVNLQRRGSTVVEASFVLSALILFLLTIFDYGRFIMVKHLADNAAREGARLAVAANTYDTNSFNYQTTATITNKVTTSFAGQDKAVTGLTVQVYLSDSSGNNIGTWTTATPGQAIAVQVDSTYNPILPGFTLPIFKTWIGLYPQNVPIHAKCVMQSEAD